jgi:hypothetical protein
MDATEHGAGHGGVRAEPDVVSAKLVVGFAIALTIFAVAAGAIVAALFWHLDRVAQKHDAAVVIESGLQRQGSEVPPLPRLQVYPVKHWTDFQTAEKERLESYGWMDQSTGAVHIPIERAIDLVAERGVAPLPPAPLVLPQAPAGAQPPHEQPQPEKKQ